jgi:hypothetical protein
MSLVNFSRHEDDHSATPDQTCTGSMTKRIESQLRMGLRRRRSHQVRRIWFRVSLRCGDSLVSGTFCSDGGVNEMLEEQCFLRWIREPETTPLVRTRDESVHVQALRALGGVLNIPCLPRQDSPKCLSAPHSRDSASLDSEANRRENLRKGDVAHRDDEFATVSNRDCGTPIAQRHCAASPHEQHKPRSTYIEESEDATKQIAV